MVADANREFRFGCGRGDELKSLSFKVGRNNDDVYVNCREIDGTKHSLHGSGIHRYAKDSVKSRKPLEYATLLDFVDGEFWTVVRILFTTASNWAPNRGGWPQKSLKLPVPTVNQAVLVNLGFSGTHPGKDSRLASWQNKVTMKVTDSKFLTATTSGVESLGTFLPKIRLIFAPDKGTNFVRRQLLVPSNDKFFDEVTHFRTKVNTFYYWVHHNIPVSSKDTWREKSAIHRALSYSYEEEIAGRTIGLSLDDADRMIRSRARPVRED